MNDKISKFNKMSRQEKRSARLLALQFIYANEITSIDKKTFFDDILNISSSINGFEQKTEILSHIDLSSDMALSVLPKNFSNKYQTMRSKLNQMETKEIINLINSFQVKLDKYKKNIQKYAFDLANTSINNKLDLDKEIISRSTNWDSSRITLMDKLILRLVMAEIIFIDHVPPKVSIAEGIEIAKSMSTKDSGAFVNGILDSFYSDWSNNKIGIKV
tara:strand:+ start:777 stop:1427 length:651 start_codon:yes stop_codon:yes gene_type:complete